MQITTLEDVIRTFIPIDPRANSRGFHPILCKVCNDHGRKGPRAGFKFDGAACGYNCFNCGFSARYDPLENDNLPGSMSKVLSAFGVQEVDWQPALYAAMVQRSQGKSPDAIVTQLRQIEPEALPIHMDFYPLEDNPEDDWAQYSIEYLESRGVDWTSQPFFNVRRSKHPTNKKWYGRLIIPCYKDGKIVFWQGRDLTDLHTLKYLSPNVSRDRILSTYEPLKLRTDEPLYVTEGWFDSHHLNGVAIFGNKMTEEQIAWLNRTNRRKVIIPDRFGDGHLLANQAIKLGWEVSTPDIGSCKDVNDAIVKYGRLYTMKTIQDNTNSGALASMRVALYCQNKPKGK